LDSELLNYKKYRKNKSKIGASPEFQRVNKKYNTETGYLRPTLDSRRRESDWKTNKFSSREKSYEPRLRLVNTISLPTFDLAGPAVVTST